MSLCCCHGDTVRDILMYMSLYFAEDCSLNYDQKCRCDVSNDAVNFNVQMWLFEVASRYITCSKMQC